MIQKTPTLHTIALNVRAQDDTYSAMPVRVLKAIADLDDIPAVLATTSVVEEHLYRVEGQHVHVIDPSRIDGLASRAGSTCDVILVDVPVDPNDLQASGALVDSFRAEVRATKIRLRVFTMEGGVLSQSPGAANQEILLGRGFVSVIRAYDFDPMLLRFKYRFPLMESLADEYLDQRNRPILAYLEDSSPIDEKFRVWLNASLQHARASKTVRSILDRP